MSASSNLFSTFQLDIPSLVAMSQAATTNVDGNDSLTFELDRRLDNGSRQNFYGAHEGHASLRPGLKHGIFSLLTIGFTSSFLKLLSLYLIYVFRCSISVQSLHVYAAFNIQ